MLNNNFFYLTINDIYRNGFIKPVYVNKYQTLDELLMKEQNNLKKDFIYVVDDENKLEGYFNLDIVLEHFFHYSSCKDDNNEGGNSLLKIMPFVVDDIMYENTTFVNADTAICEVIKIMYTEMKLELPVLDARQKLLGVVYFSDILSAFYKLNNRSEAVYETA